MSRVASLSLNVLLVLVAIAAVAAPRVVAAPDADARSDAIVRRDLAQTGAAEIGFGTFSGSRSGTTEPVTYVWSYDDAGTQIEVWALFRPGTTNGWTFPGSNATSVDLTIDYEGSPSFASVGDFLQWCEDQYPSAMNVDKDFDFDVHEHTVEIL